MQALFFKKVRLSQSFENPNCASFLPSLSVSTTQALTSVKKVATMKPIVSFGREEIQNCARLSTRCA
ncbi:MAG: hypothetical protein DME80_14240 [Verrucomicrobia bacterium]|nr:MAG: hypothetical protein DME80_14240 [Verrucomicrobiota bacterium]